MCPCKVPEAAVVARGEVGRVVAPGLLGTTVLARGWQQAAPLGAALRQKGPRAVAQRPVQVWEAKVRRGECDDAAHDHVNKICRVVKGSCEVDHAEHSVFVAVSGRTLADGIALGRRKLPRRNSSRDHALGTAVDCRHSVRPGVHLRCGGAAAVSAAKRVLGRVRSIYHCKPTLYQAQAVRQGGHITGGRLEPLDHDAIPHALRDDTARSSSTGEYNLCLDAAQGRWEHCVRELWDRPIVLLVCAPPHLQESGKRGP
mmetsp:Transcript_69945/g.198238  ORF Transcript_69945/g.198238 Transcript_69945/m.198238 type:complete len:257 (+) Transcript_69945:1059-1829(+)